MADKEFNIKDQLDPIEVTLNIPPFLSDKGQFDEEEVENTQSVASVRIHVERVISRIKMYKIITNVVPLPLAGVLIIFGQCVACYYYFSPQLSTRIMKKGDHSGIYCYKFRFEIPSLERILISKVASCLSSPWLSLLIALKGKASSEKNKVHEL